MTGELRPTREIRADLASWNARETRRSWPTTAGGWMALMHLADDVAPLLARMRAADETLAAVEALAGEIVRAIDKEWLTYQQTLGSDAEHEARLTGAMSGLSQARLIVQSAFRAALAEGASR